MPGLHALAMVVAVLLLPSAVPAADITACGQLVSAGEIGVLQADLACTSPILGCYRCPNGGCFPTGVACTVDADCAPPDGRCSELPGVAIESGGTLDMNGHAIVAPTLVAVNCRSKGRCTVTSSTGRGDVSSSLFGILMRAGKLTVSHVDVHDNSAGIFSPLLATKMTLTDVTADNNVYVGIRGDTVRATDVTANGNGLHGIEANGKLTGTNVVTNDNAGIGTFAGKGARLTGFTSTGNGTGGGLHSGAGLIVAASGPHLTNATVTGNAYNDGSGLRPLDLISPRNPKLATTTCDHSVSFDRKTGVLGATWGVCAGD